MKILICQLRNYGDIIRTFPLIESLKYFYPDSYVALTCIREMGEVCKLCTSIDEVIFQPKLEPVINSFNGSRVCDFSDLSESVIYTQNQDFDFYIDLHGVFQSSIFGLLSNIPNRIGRSYHTTRDGAHLTYNIIAKIESKLVNKMERHFIIAKRYFHKVQPIEKKNFVEAEDIVIIPGSSKKGILKRWNYEKYISLIKKFPIEKKILVLIGPEEKELFDKFDINYINKVEVHMIKTWQDYIEHFRKASLTIGNDTAAMHLSIWLNIPTFMLCGPTPSEVNGVWKFGKGKDILSDCDCKCGNVWSGVCSNNSKCLEGISVDDVLRIIDKCLK